MTDAELYRRCHRGDPDAWRRLIRDFSPLVYRLAVRLLGAGHEAEDACQEVFLRVHQSFETFDPTRTLAPWVSKIAYNVCLRRLGKTSRKVADSTDPEDLVDLPDQRVSGPETRTAEKEAEELLVGALAQLAAQDRALVTMRYREGLSIAEVSEATGIPVNTVKIRLHRAWGRLKEILAPTLREDG